MFNKIYSQDELMHIEEIQEIKTTILSGGMNSDGMKMNVSDVLAMPNAPLVFRRVITELVQEAIEPILVGTRLLDRVNYEGYGETVKLTTMGGLGTMNLDMAEGQEYPEYTVPMNKSEGMTVTIGKSGIAVKITEEMIRYSQWDLIALNIRHAAFALSRHKERKIFNMINNTGYAVLDNANPDTSQLGRTTGRGLSGAGNGSATVDDIFDMYAATMERGFTPDTLMVHPLMWASFIKDPVLREMALNGSGANKWYNGLPNNVHPAMPDVWKQLSKKGIEKTMNPSFIERSPTQQSIPNLPYQFPFGELSIIPSFNIPFNPETKTTTMIMLDRSELGALVVGEDPTAEEWTDPARDIRKVKVRERYGIALYHNGEGVSVARNISVEPNQLVLPPQAIVNDLPEIVRKNSGGSHQG